MTPLPIIAANDPRNDNPARAILMDILHGVCPPPNYRVTLHVDKATEKLVLRILKRSTSELRIWGLRVWSNVQSWDHDECEQRRLTGRTYESILNQLKDSPEFLEFEYAQEGLLRFEQVVNL